MLEDADGLLRFTSLTGDRPVPHAFAPAVAFGGFDARRAADRERLRDELDPSRSVVATRQKHTAVVAQADALPDGAFDGLVTDRDDIALLAVSADCPLVLLWHRDGDAVGVVHAGWRGVAAGVVEAGVEAMERLGATADGLAACVTPSAGGCCYEVGEEVVLALAVDGDRAFVTGRTHRGSLVDLKRAIRDRLVARGVADSSIEPAPHCTICGGERFHSYRRTGTGVSHMAAAIARPPETGAPPARGGEWTSWRADGGR